MRTMCRSGRSDVGSRNGRVPPRLALPILVSLAAAIGYRYATRPGKRLPLPRPRRETSMADLIDQVVLVTGGSRGIGAAIARAAASSGADVAVSYLDRPDEALTEYVSIYEAMPDSAWGMLAALHLEKVE